ncbi:MAG: arsenate reductase [Paracoccaceae bacterium]
MTPVRRTGIQKARITAGEPGVSVTIYHNPRCSKSRATLALLEEKGIVPEIIEYLGTPPSKEEMNRILDGLDMAPRDLMRRKEQPYAALNLGDDSMSRDALIDAILANPILMERPVVVKGGKYALGRPPENVLEIL